MMGVSQKLLARSAVFLLVVMLLGVQVRAEQESSNQCPAINCDCDSISLIEWKTKCIEAEQKIKSICAANMGTPLHYCSLQGMAPKPVALGDLGFDVPEANSKSLKQHKRQVVMLLWSVNDDLDNIRLRVENEDFGEALQVHKLLDENIDRLYATQRKAAEGERQRSGDEAANILWENYRKELTKVIAQFDEYGDALWARYENALSPKNKKAYQILTMRILRTASTLSEQQARAYEGEGSSKAAALAWQKAANAAKNLIEKERASGANAKHISYYQNQSAARWGRASFYWMKVNNKEAIETAVAAAIGE